MQYRQSQRTRRHVVRPITWRVSAMKPAKEWPESGLELVLPLNILPHKLP